MHFKTENRSMVMEKIQLHSLAFDNHEDEPNEQATGRSTIRPLTGPNRTSGRFRSFGATRPKTALVSLDTNQEMDFIRGETRAQNDKARQSKRPQTSTSFLDYVQDYRETQQMTQSSYQSSSKRYILPSQL